MVRQSRVLAILGRSVLVLGHPHRVMRAPAARGIVRIVSIASTERGRRVAAAAQQGGGAP